jgi:5'/3'-nucleotidase SurE
VSLVNRSECNFATAAQVALEMVKRFMEKRVHVPVLLNINVPDVPLSRLAGMEVTRLGRRHKAEPVIKSTNPRGETIYWVGAAGIAQDAGEGTDFFAVQNNKISIILAPGTESMMAFFVFSFENFKFEISSKIFNIFQLSYKKALNLGYECI